MARLLTLETNSQRAHRVRVADVCGTALTLRRLPTVSPAPTPNAATSALTIASRDAEVTHTPFVRISQLAAVTVACAVPWACAISLQGDGQGVYGPRGGDGFTQERPPAWGGDPARLSQLCFPGGVRTFPYREGSLRTITGPFPGPISGPIHTRARQRPRISFRPGVEQWPRVASEDNAEADDLSRPDADQYVRLDEGKFAEICAWAGCDVDVDLMATPASAQRLPGREQALRFYSRFRTEGREGVDALGQDLSKIAGSTDPSFGFLFPFNHYGWSSSAAFGRLSSECGYYSARRAENMASVTGRGDSPIADTSTGGRRVRVLSKGSP